MNAAAKTAAQRNVDLDAQNCFAGEPLLLKTRNDIFFRIMQPPSFLESAKKNLWDASHPEANCASSATRLSYP